MSNLKNLAVADFAIPCLRKDSEDLARMLGTHPAPHHLEIEFVIIGRTRSGECSDDDPGELHIRRHICSYDDCPIDPERLPLPVLSKIGQLLVAADMQYVTIRTMLYTDHLVPSEEAGSLAFRIFHNGTIKDITSYESAEERPLTFLEAAKQARLATLTHQLRYGFYTVICPLAPVDDTRVRFVNYSAPRDEEYFVISQKDANMAVFVPTISGADGFWQVQCNVYQERFNFGNDLESRFLRRDIINVHLLALTRLEP